MKSNEANGGCSAVLSTAGLGAVVDAGKLVELLLDQHWHKGCEIIDGYMPPYPGPETRPTVVVRCASMNAFLRYSKGPRQCFFWDVYGDDMQTVELAVVALASAPAPRDCSPVTFTLTRKAPNAEVRVASRLAGEASSREAATSTDVLCAICHGEGGWESCGSSTNYFWKECHDCNGTGKAK